MRLKTFQLVCVRSKPDGINKKVLAKFSISLGRLPSHNFSSRYRTTCFSKARLKGIGENSQIAQSGRSSLSSCAACFAAEYRANFRIELAGPHPQGAREFKSSPLRHPVSRFSDISENRSKSARVRYSLANGLVTDLDVTISRAEEIERLD